MVTIRGYIMDASVHLSTTHSPLVSIEIVTVNFTEHRKLLDFTRENDDAVIVISFEVEGDSQVDHIGL